LSFAFAPGFPMDELYELEQIDDVNAVGALTRLLDESAGEDFRAACAVALVRLLPRMTDAEIALLDKAQRARLCGQLQIKRAESEFKLQMALLNLLKTAGWPESLPIVRQLATSLWSNNYQERI